ncbi:profilin [Lentinula edodes]|uniref:Profilin n=1 Tax=Lentinula edodes TaxID=5353 RepID=A0A1Q3EH05_LENED|nr:profilin [Lentinula edodes]
MGVILRSDHGFLDLSAKSFEHFEFAAISGALSYYILCLPLFSYHHLHTLPSFSFLRNTSVMSWQAYVDTNLVGTTKIAQAAILGAQGGVWATSEGFEISPDEQARILQAHSQPSAIQASGLVIAGVKYFCLQANERSIYLKKGVDGAIVVKTTQAILCYARIITSKYSVSETTRKINTPHYTSYSDTVQ